MPLTLIYLLIWPIIIYIILRRNKKKLRTEEMKASIGSLYMNYETEKDSVLHFTMWFLYRRFLFAFIIGYCKVDIVLQVYLTSNSSLLLLSYILYWEPMEADHYDFLAVFNEAVLTFCTYMQLLYTEMVPVPEVRYMYGNIFLYVLYIDVGLNLVLLGYEITRMVVRSCKRRILHKKLRLERQIKL